MELPAIPSLRFDNRTDFDALHLDTIDQNGVAFHVLVAKTAYSLGPHDADGNASLVALDESAKLYTEDRYFEGDIERSVRHESDLAPYKPRCDVVVIADAHAPHGRAARRFKVSLHVQRPDRPAPRRPGEVLVNKTLIVTGERQLRRRAAPVRLLLGALNRLSLGMVRLSPYRLTSPEPARTVPLRYEFAQGGQCRVEPDAAGARRIPKKVRLTPDRQAQYSPEPAPIAHDSCQLNPVGRGFSRRWFLGAARVKSLPAPRVEYPDAPFTPARFWQATLGKPALLPAGLGYVGRGWLPRRELVGQFDSKDTWGQDEIPALPKNFDFRYWNGAPDDQQCAHLEGGERFTLTNLCAADAAYASLDEGGNSRLAFVLPQQSLFLLGSDESGAVAAMPLSIDTVVVDVEGGVVELVWRRCLVADGEFADVRLLHAATPEQLQRLHEWTNPAAEEETPPASRDLAATTQ